MSCSQCFQGTIHDGVPQGKETHLYGRSTYIAEPPEGSEIKGIIMIVSDALGWTFSNMRVLADNMAKEGSFRVYLPEFMNGWSLNRSSLLAVSPRLISISGTAAPSDFLDIVDKLMYDRGLAAWLWKPYEPPSQSHWATYSS